MERIATRAGMNRAWRSSGCPPRGWKLLAAPLTAFALRAQPARLAAHLFFDMPELGHIDQQGEGGRLAEAGDRHENVEPRPEGGIALELLAQGLVDGVDLALDLGAAVRRLAP